MYIMGNGTLVVFHNITFKQNNCDNCKIAKQTVMQQKDMILFKCMTLWED